MSDRYGLDSEVIEMVEVCEEYADELFDDDTWFTGITKWQDGDFRVAVRRGDEHEKSPYRQRIELVSYHHEDGYVVYADFDRFIDHKFDDVHERLFLGYNE